MQTAIIGKIEEIQELQLKGANKDFKVQNVIVEVDCSYKNANGETVTASQPIKVEFKQKNTELLKSHKVGDNVEINWNLRGRKWLGANQQEPTYFISIEGWKIAKYIIDTEALDTAQVESDLPF
jgi:hypothetical protein